MVQWKSLDKWKSTGLRTLVSNLTSTFYSYMTLGQLVNPSQLYVLICKMAIMICLLQVIVRIRDILSKVTVNFI